MKRGIARKVAAFLTCSAIATFFEGNGAQYYSSESSLRIFPSLLGTRAKSDSLGKTLTSLGFFTHLKTKTIGLDDSLCPIKTVNNNDIIECLDLWIEDVHLRCQILTDLQFSGGTALSPCLCGVILRPHGALESPVGFVKESDAQVLLQK